MIFRKLAFAFIALLSLGIALPSVAADRLPLVGAKAQIFRHGIPTDMTEEDNKKLKSIIKFAFKGQETSSEKASMRQSFIANGKSLEQQWEEALTKSFFQFSGLAGKSKSRYTTVNELLITIEEDADKKPLGNVYAKLPNGEIRGYTLAGEKIIPLYCATFLQKYLPDHYQRFSETYNTPDYAKAGVICSDEMKALVAEENKPRSKMGMMKQPRSESDTPEEQDGQSSPDDINGENSEDADSE